MFINYVLVAIEDVQKTHTQNTEDIEKQQEC